MHLGERECSIQRRHQKLIEESPSPALSEKMRRKMGSIVIDAAKAVQYTNAGTFEFLMDPDGRFYFMEANTRLQVEHPVTEMVTGIDIVKEQIRIAAGERLSFKQSEVTFTGHSIECRINAEDPDTFVPSPGVIHVFSVPGGPGVRVETFAHSDCTISPYYDSMIAKIIVHGRDRQEAIARMKRTLEMTVIEGIKTTIPLHLTHPGRSRVRRRQAEHVVHGALPRAPYAGPSRRGGLTTDGNRDSGFGTRPHADQIPAPESRIPNPEPRIPSLNAIVDVDVAARAGWAPVDLAAAYLRGGARFLQIRAKQADWGRFLDLASQWLSWLAPAMPWSSSTTARTSRGWPVPTAFTSARTICRPRTFAALSATWRSSGSPRTPSSRSRRAMSEPVSYLAIGPVFGTATKATGYDAIGLEMVRAAAAHARAGGLPLVAIGGITLETAASVLEAGAASVAVIGDLLATDDPESRVRAFLERLEQSP